MRVGVVSSSGARDGGNGGALILIKVYYKIQSFISLSPLLQLYVLSVSLHLRAPTWSTRPAVTGQEPAA